jgi:hypothetical protein
MPSGTYAQLPGYNDKDVQTAYIEHKIAELEKNNPEFKQLSATPVITEAIGIMADAIQESSPDTPNLNFEDIQAMVVAIEQQEVKVPENPVDKLKKHMDDTSCIDPEEFSKLFVSQPVPDYIDEIIPSPPKEDGKESPMEDNLEEQLPALPVAEPEP